MASESTILLNLLNWHPKKIEAVLAFAGSVSRVVELNLDDLRRIPCLTETEAVNFFKARDGKALKEELSAIEDEGVICVDLFDKNYPLPLREIANPPLLLYIKGDIGVFDDKMFAIVGSRLATRYGSAMAEFFSYQLAALGLVVVSGLARGIDTAAHKKAIVAGKSIAVLGSGLCDIYPKENRALAANIEKRGAVISEFPMFSSPQKENFPRRNRIVSGLSEGVLVVEAAARSGALITARMAIEQNREVFVLPGNINSPTSKGSNGLLKDGAKPVDSVEDILEEFSFKWRLKRSGARPEPNFQETEV
jgi:DNA processing protein